MIEGLRLAPWFFEAHRRGLLGPLSNCGECMNTRSQQTRQMVGCGYAPRPAAALLRHMRPWAGLGYSGPDPTTCPGYTAHLPEVVEVMRARVHWSKGSLPAFTRGETPTDALIQGIEILEGASNEVQAWSVKPAKDGGGGA